MDVPPTCLLESNTPPRYGRLYTSISRRSFQSCSPPSASQLPYVSTAYTYTTMPMHINSLSLPLPLPILIHGVPHVGAKSRVETQIKMTLDLAAFPGQLRPLPSTDANGVGGGYDRVGTWRYLRLPKGTSTRRRARKDPKIGELVLVLRFVWLVAWFWRFLAFLPGPFCQLRCGHRPVSSRLDDAQALCSSRG